MFSISFLLFVCLTTTFANNFFPNINEENPINVPQQVPQQDDQLYSSSAPHMFMQGNPNAYQIPQQAMMQGFQSPFPFNPLNQQQLSLLLMSAYARMIALTQLINVQNRYQPFGQYSDPAMNNFVQTPVPLPYAQQPQVEAQNNFRNEMLQQQQKEAELQHQAILEERRVQREYDMEIQRREELIKRQVEEENRQREIEQEIEMEKKEAERQILEEEREEEERIENDRKLREEEELRSKQIEEEKLKQIHATKPNMKPIIKGLRRPIKLKVQPAK